MSRCRACDNEIEVKWTIPDGCKVAILENLCYSCLLWVDVGKQPAVTEINLGRRKPNYEPLPWEES